MKRVGNGTDTVLQLVFRAYHKRIDRAVRDIATGAELCGIKRCGPLPLPTRKKNWSILRSPFVDKKAQELITMHTHKRLLILEGDRDTLNRFINFVTDTMEPIVTFKVFEASLHDISKYWTFGNTIAKARSK